MYDPNEIPTGPTFLKEPDDVSNINKARSTYHSSFIKGADQKSDDYMNNYLASRGEDFSTREGWLKARADYFANITLVDRMVGRIIDSLKKNNLYENTILVFTSEHGEMMGDHGMLEKRTLYEESAKVPLLMKLPGLDGSQKKIKGSFSHIDLVPTLLSLMNQEQSNNLQGEDKSDCFKTLNLDENVVVVEWNGTGEIDDRNLGSEEINELNTNPRRSIIIDRMKLNLTLDDDGELFDLDSDPFEEKNLFHDTKYVDVIDSMKNSLIKWQEINNDNFRFE
jgi:choline-sulfatase